jgi:hypothetical protein
MKPLAVFAAGPFVERYVTTILLPASGDLPNEIPSPKFNS